MDNEKIMDILKLTAATLQTGYPSDKDASAAICQLLEEVDKAAIEISGKGIVRRGRINVLEEICGNVKLAQLRKEWINLC